MYYVLLLNLAFFVGVVGLVCNPSPFLATLALVLASGFGCGVVAGMGSFFTALVLFLVYLGGMLVVLAYSVAMAVDMYLEFGGNRFFGFFVVCLMVLSMIIDKLSDLVSFGVGGFNLNYIGVSLLYSSGGYYLFSIGYGLLLALFVVLELVRWISFGSYKV